MATTRTTAGDHSNMTSVFKPVVSYAKTVGSAVSDFVRAHHRAVDASLDFTPGANARARVANKRQTAEQGQLLGAILQGRKYNNKTGKIIQGKGK